MAEKSTLEIYSKQYLNVKMKNIKDAVQDPRVNKSLIIVNAIRCPNGDILQSRHVHDFVMNSQGYAVDGGLSYLRRVFPSVADYEELSLYYGDDHAKIRELFDWGTRGIDGKQPLTYVKLKDLTYDHLQAIIHTQHQLPAYIHEQFLRELSWRTNEIITANYVRK